MIEFYWCGVVFTIAYLFQITKDEPDTWKNAFLIIMTAFIFPIFWGTVLGDKAYKQGEQKNEEINDYVDADTVSTDG